MPGLHKEPSKFPNVGPREVQVRRQIWWVLVCIDSQVAFASGLPPLVQCKYVDVQMPDESPADLATEGLDVQSNNRKSILGILFGGKVQFVRRACDFLHLLHNTFFNKEDLEEVLRIVKEISIDMQARCEEIDELERTVLGKVPDQGQDTNLLRQTEYSPTLAKFAKMILPMFAAKPYSIMHGPVKRHGLLDHLRHLQPE